MGRRILPKLDPSVDYSTHLSDLDELAKELCAPGLSPTFRNDQLVEPYAPRRIGDNRPLFVRAQPLELEIGCGKGLFLCNQSAAFPHHKFLGVEIAHKYARFSAYRLAKLGRSNAHLIRGDGLALLRDWLPDCCLVAIHVYFPDPWWKARHRKRRVVSQPLGEQALRTLQPGGWLIFWTDVEEYFDEGCASIRNSGAWRECDTQPPLSALASPDHRLDSEGRTHFDRRMIRHEHEVFRRWFQKP